MVNQTLLQCKHANHKGIITRIKFAEAQSLIASALQDREHLKCSGCGEELMPFPEPGIFPQFLPPQAKPRVRASPVGLKGCTYDAYLAGPCRAGKAYCGNSMFSSLKVVPNNIFKIMAV